MQKIINAVLKRNMSTQRVDDMPNTMATAAMNLRMNRLLQHQALQPLPRRQFDVLSNPNQKQANS
jgi:hypothetical protein